MKTCPLGLIIAPVLLIAGTLLRYVHARSAHDLQRSLPGLPIGLWRSLNEQDLVRHDAVLEASGLRTKYPAHTLDVPVDHMDVRSNATFPLRYWYDSSFYKSGGPVFVIEGGETSGEDRLQFLSQGIGRILAEATSGLAVVLEHRYYGESWPVPNLSTDNLRFLTTHQAVADNAFFTEHAEFPSLSQSDNDAIRHAKWIHYGGSYAGAKVALLKKLYPKVIHGAIASSAVTAAIVDYWKYFEGIRLHADAECVDAIIQSVSLVDTILAIKSHNATQRLKDLFGLSNVTHIEDVVSMMTYPLGAWQARNWDPDVSSTGFEDFCTDLLAIRSPANGVSTGGQHPLFAETAASGPLMYLSNYARYIRNLVGPLCKDRDQDECFGTFDREAYEKHSLNETWRAWTWQYCTEWGFLQNAPPSGVPSIISRHISLEYSHMVCELAFPEGKHIKMPKMPNATMINQYGGLDFQEDRVAFIDGSDDPWLYATPHSPDAKKRKSTLVRPFELIKGGVHHWDENGLPDDGNGKRKEEPAEIRRVHEREIEFVKAWLDM